MRRARSSFCVGDRASARGSNLESHARSRVGFSHGTSIDLELVDTRAWVWQLVFVKRKEKLSPAAESCSQQTG
eukprot:3670520-Rhodomonas_salina.1